MLKLALILAAGHGSRLRPHVPVPHKALVDLDGEPLLARTCRLLDENGMDEIIIVTGYQSQALRTALCGLSLQRARLHFVENRRWDLSNGLSVLAATKYLGRPYLLLMADHLFDPDLLLMMARQNPLEGAVLAVDRKLDYIYDMDDATKVKIDAEFIVEIGKELESFNAVDTGLFACSGALAQCIEDIVAAQGDCSLTEGMRALAARQHLRAFDIGQAWWQDIATPETLAHGARLLKLPSAAGCSACPPNKDSSG